MIVSSISETLRLTNGRVQNLTKRMQYADDDQGVVTSQDFEALLGEVTRAASWLRQVSPQFITDAELDKEVFRYRSTLQQLERMLPGIQSRLLAEKVRLEATHARLTAVTAWATTSQGTL